MEGRREDVETYHSPSVSPHREVDDFSQMYPLPDICQSGRSAIVRSQALMSIWPFFKMFSSVFESFSLATTCSPAICKLCKTYLSGGDGFPTF